MVRALPFGWRQFVLGLPGDVGPFDRSLWLCSDGFFYVLKIIPAFVTSSAQTTPTMIISATRLASRLVSTSLFRQTS